ncbi:endopeptidase La [Egicoccus sp. AB-alg2]|uniref:endopeptidase La n=1 Tax=Egicoccus sp. AB-alg2 TaxID=3242693 RepID=UPI00359D5505
MSVVGTDRLPMLALDQGVVVPTMVVNVIVESGEAATAVAAAEGGDARLLLVPRVDGRYSSVGTIAQIVESYDLEGNRAVVLRGLRRARPGGGSMGSDQALWVDVEVLAEDEPTARTRELAVSYRAVLDEILRLRQASTVAERLAMIDDLAELADTAVYSPDLTLAQKVEVLETLDLTARLELVLGWARETLAQVKVERDVRRQVGERVDKQQREYLLRQQLQAIREELGETGSAEDGDYRQRLADLDAPAAVKQAIERELDRLERVGEQSPEHSWIQTWLDTVFEVPWNVRPSDRLDLAEARSVLDADHTGLDDVKERLVEHLAVRKLRHERGLDTVADGAVPARRGAGQILLLVGPPGVGKTSLGESVARSMGRPFVRVALGGVRDEAEVRGHRRTYVGARPGRIVRALTEAKAINPVLLLDELDKVGADWRGDPSSALLEVLDPAQNHTFRDHYLELDLDLSDVVFLATANVLETIPAALLDRMEVVRLDGYTDDEKVSIAREHLLPRQVERAGLRPDEVEVPDTVLNAVIGGWTREAGVRGLERALGRLMRRAASRIGSDPGVAPVAVDEPMVRDVLGRPTVHLDEAAGRTAVPGVAIGLAVTGAGGDVLFVEASLHEGDEGLTLTGQLGDVMKESATIATSYVRAHAAELGIAPDALAGRRVHLHVPAGAVPKDGPSAGITMVTALVSALTGRPVRDDIGMTGEVTLQGRVLPIGGVKQKVLAAHRAGVRTVVLPARNGDDVDDLPAAVRDLMDVHLVEDVRDVLAVALTAPAAAAA